MFSAAIKTAAAAGGYQISRSLRFNSADSAYLNRTPASAGNRTTWTWSGWAKVCDVSNYGLFCIDSNNRFLISSGNLFFDYQTAGTYRLVSSAVYRDPSAWYHIVLAVDTTQATASNRIKIYVNGSQVTDFSTANYPTQNLQSSFNNTVQHNIGAENARYYFNGYMTEVNFIDGQALTPSSFGQTNAQTGVWEPVAYSGSYGTNGFYLNFSDNSNTTAATLGKDYSGNGNNWTPNNFSVSAGAGNDSLVDTPTPYGLADTGVGGEVRGNYCTLNPLANNGGTLANGNLDHTGTTAITSSTLFPSTGQWYCEFTCTAYGGGGSLGYTAVGVIQSNQSINTVPNSLANVPVGLWIYRNDAQKANNGVSASYGNTWTANDVIGIAYDADDGILTFYKNGVSQGTAYTNLSGSIAPAINDQGVYSTSFSFNAGQRPFAYTAPAGFRALTTWNLPTPTIGATSTTQADDYFNAVLYTGDRTDRTITVGFQPDWVWVKSRNQADNHYLMNAVVGTGKYLCSNLTDAEATNANTLTAFTSTGFSIGNTGTTNETGRTYVAWNWKANGAGSTNTAGSITSTVSANTTAGFSVVTYTGNGTNGATVGHGLGVAPSFFVVKERNGSSSWVVYTAVTGNTQFLVLNNTDAVQTASTLWNNTSPTSTVFTVGTSGAVNTNTSTYVAYCFAPIAGYSRFGSYTGNGSTDGPFVFCGFRPKYLLIKKTDSIPAGNGEWIIFDGVRKTYNWQGPYLLANSSAAEGSSAEYIDFLSNGFKFRSSNSTLNGNGSVSIYAAFAEFPFKYSLAL